MLKTSYISKLYMYWRSAHSVIKYTKINYFLLSSFHAQNNMYHKMVLKRIIFPLSSSAFLAATVVPNSETKEEEKKVLIRARDLPIYSKPAEQSNEQEIEPKSESALLSVVKQVREGLWAVTDQLGEVTDKMNNIIETGKAHTSSTIQILRDKDNYAQRYGAIAVGGLVGYIIAIRRGWFRHIIYTGTGADAVAAICSPEEAKEYSSEGFRLTKRYIVIAYHFVNRESDKKQGTNSKKSISEQSSQNDDEDTDPEPIPASYFTRSCSTCINWLTETRTTTICTLEEPRRMSLAVILTTCYGSC